MSATSAAIPGRWISSAGSGASRSAGSGPRNPGGLPLSSSEAGPPAASATEAQQVARGAAIALRSMGEPNSFARRFDFWDSQYEWRRVFSELLGTFLLVLVAAGGGMVNARFGGHLVPAAARVVAPCLIVLAIIMFMGAVSGAHLNPAVSIAFALRGNFPWRRV